MNRNYIVQLSDEERAQLKNSPYAVGVNLVHEKRQPL